MTPQLIERHALALAETSLVCVLLGALFAEGAYLIWGVPHLQIETFRTWWMRLALAAIYARVCRSQSDST